MTLAVTVALASPIFAPARARAASARIRQRTEAELAALLRDLGLPAQLDVQVETSDAPPAALPIRLYVTGRECRFPAATIAEALAYVTATPQVVADPVTALDSLPGADGSGWPEVAELVALTCRAAVSAQPGVLIAATDDPVLREVVSLGISAAARGQAADEPASDDSGGDPVERAIAASAASTIDVDIDPAYLRVLTTSEAAEEMFRFTREGLYTELGLSLPPIRLHPDPSLRPAGFAFRINSLRTLPRIGLPPDTILVNDTPERLSQAWPGIRVEPTLNPATHQPSTLTDREHQETLEASELTTWNALGFLILCLAAAVRRNAHALMTRDIAASMTGQLAVAFPVLGETTRDHVPPDTLTPVLRDLLLDAIPISNLRRILELLLRHETAGPEGHFPDRTTFVRSGLADLIAFKAARGTGTVVVYLLDPVLEKEIGEYEQGAKAAGNEHSLPGRLSAAVRAELSYLPPTAQRPALLTRDELRRPVRRLLRPEFPYMGVLAYGDLPPDCNVQPVARISPP
jgi:type III secretory pathway component EscV